ncbi:MAG: DUF4836 family protein [Prevotellaceae bacterium]|jgi:hypothetical protein|nr:DUF4836 family protein [Prevotellaceae bacterium]
MKFFKLIFFLFILGCYGFTSCSTNVSTANQLSLIPDNATIVFEVNAREVFAKSGLNSPDDYVLFNMMKQFTDSNISGFLENFFKGSKDAGINAEKILFYMTKLQDFAVIVPVIDKKAFENWLKKADLPEPMDEGDFRFISIVDNLNMVWNDNVAMIANASSREQIAAQIKPKDNGLMATSDDFRQFANKNADIRLWFNYSALMDLYRSIIFLRLNPFADEPVDSLFSGLENLENLSSHSYLNFEDGKITGKSSFYPPEEVEKFQKKFPIFKKSFNTEILKDMPEQSYLAFNAYFDVGEYIKILRQNIENMLSGGSMRTPEIEQRSEEMFEFFDSPDLKSVVDALGGDILVSIHGFNKGLISYPLASASFTVNGEKAFKDILKLLPQNLYKKQDGYYETSTSKTYIPIYFAYKSNRVFVSLDLNTVKAFTDEKKGKTFADNPVSKIMTDRMMFYINLDFATYPDNIKMLLQSITGQQRYAIFTSLADIYEYMYFSTDTDYEVEFNLQLKNKNVNSLKQILKSIDKAGSSSWMK